VKKTVLKQINWTLFDDIRSQLLIMNFNIGAIYIDIYTVPKEIVSLEQCLFTYADITNKVFPFL
jgi:hypothetical protein